MFPSWLPELAWAALAALLVLNLVRNGASQGLGIVLPWLDKWEHRQTVADLAQGYVPPSPLAAAGWLAMAFLAIPTAMMALLTALMIPVMIWLAGFGLRHAGAAFRPRAEDARFVWTGLWSTGCWLSTFGLGMMAGGVLQGIPTVQERFHGSIFSAVSAYTVFTGAAVTALHILLGASWASGRTLFRLERHCRRLTQAGLAAVFAVFVIFCVWTPLIQPMVAARWFVMPDFFWLCTVPLLACVLGLMAHQAAQHNPRTCYRTTQWFVGLIATGALYGVWPYALPFSIALEDASAAPEWVGLACLIGVGMAIYEMWAMFPFGRRHPKTSIPAT